MDEYVQQLFEMMGVYTAPNSQTQNSQQASNQNFRNNNQSIRVSHCGNLKGWQQDIVNSLRSGKDVYPIVSPGGGKTLPIICYWVQEFLGINLLRNVNDKTILDYVNKFISPNLNIPKMMYLVPRRQLAEQTNSELTQVLVQIITQVINLYLKSYDPQDRNRKQHFENTFSKWLNEYTHMHNREFELFMREFNSMNNNPQSYNESIVSKFQQMIEEAVLNLINNKLLYFSTGGRKSNADPRTAPITVAVYQSAASNQQIKKNLSITQLIICDEAHLSQPVDVDHVDPSESEDIAQSLYQILYGLNSNRSQLVMISGTQNPKSAKEFCLYLNKTFNRKFNVPSIRTTGDRNQSDIEIIPDDSIHHDNGLVKSILQNINNNTWGNLYVLFSIKKIMKISEECLSRLGRQNLNNISNNKKYDSEFQSHLRSRSKRPQNMQDVNVSSDNITKNITPEARKLENPFLRECVSAGIGVIARNLYINGDKIETPENDKTIIADLFKNGKIKVLLATDSVGVGVNIDVKQLYIPSLEKFSGLTKSNEEIILRDLSQIINRVGRSATPKSIIYTPEENLSRVMSAQNSDPDNFELSNIVSFSPSKKDEFIVAYYAGKSMLSWAIKKGIVTMSVIARQYYRNKKNKLPK